jgi:hypothetical protein
MTQNHMTRDQLNTLSLKRLIEIAREKDIFFSSTINGKALDYRDVIDFILKNQKASYDQR